MFSYDVPAMRGGLTAVSHPKGGGGQCHRSTACRGRKCYTLFGNKKNYFPTHPCHILKPPVPSFAKAGTILPSFERGGGGDCFGVADLKDRNAQTQYLCQTFTSITGQTSCFPVMKLKL